MAYTDATRNAALTTVAARGNWISLHTGDPGATGAAECTGGTYARIQTTWGTPASDASLGSSVTVTPSGTALYWGIWSASSGGTFVGGWLLPTAQSSQFQLTPSLTD